MRNSRRTGPILFGAEGAVRESNGPFGAKKDSRQLRFTSEQL